MKAIVKIKPLNEGAVVPFKTYSMPRYKVGDKIGQICISETPRIVFRIVNELKETERGVCGYGSTGLNVE